MAKLLGRADIAYPFFVIPAHAGIQSPYRRKAKADGQILRQKIDMGIKVASHRTVATGFPRARE